MCLGRTNLARDQLLNCIKITFLGYAVGRMHCFARGLNNCIIKFLAKRNTEFYVQLDP